SAFRGIAVSYISEIPLSCMGDDPMAPLMLCAEPIPGIVRSGMWLVPSEVKMGAKLSAKVNS
ncbi:MAG: hypothetical protein ACYTDV_18190, partial [Planctomycetota bacterium]